MQAACNKRTGKKTLPNSVHEKHRAITATKQIQYEYADLPCLAPATNQQERTVGGATTKRLPKPRSKLFSADKH